MNKVNYFKTRIYPVFNHENADQFVSPVIYGPTIVKYPGDSLKRDPHLTSYLSAPKLSKIRSICQNSENKFVTSPNVEIDISSLKFDSVLIGVEGKPGSEPSVYEVSLLDNPDQFEQVGNQLWLFKTTSIIKTEANLTLTVDDEVKESPTFESKLTVVSMFDPVNEILKSNFYFINDRVLNIGVLGYKLNTVIYSPNLILPEE